MCPLLRTLDQQRQSCSDRLDFRHSSIGNPGQERTIVLSQARYETTYLLP